ncbi:MAG: hypothetical protein AAF637_08820 [Pseudomonadota bacterium]
MLAIPEEYAAFASTYLTGGYHKDAAILDDVQIGRTSVGGRFRMTSRFEPPEGGVDLSIPNVVSWILQLAVIYGCTQHGLSGYRNLSLREVSLKALRPVEDLSSITVRIRVRFRRPVPQGVYYVGDIDVADGGYAGRIGFTFPTDSPDSKC